MSTDPSDHELSRCTGGLKALQLSQPGGVPALVDAAAQCLQLRAWQARGSALSILQCTWFRCALCCQYLACLLVHDLDHIVELMVCTGAPASSRDMSHTGPACRNVFSLIQGH